MGAGYAPRLADIFPQQRLPAVPVLEGDDSDACKKAAYGAGHTECAARNPLVAGSLSCPATGEGLMPLGRMSL